VSRPPIRDDSPQASIRKKIRFLLLPARASRPSYVSTLAERPHEKPEPPKRRKPEEERSTPKTDATPAQSPPVAKQKDGASVPEKDSQASLKAPGTNEGTTSTSTPSEEQRSRTAHRESVAGKSSG